MDWAYLFTSFEGRINRQPFWIGSIVLLVVNVVISLILTLLFGDGLIGAVLNLIIALAMLYFSFAVMVKRCHDRGKSGWWSLIALIPLIGLIWVIIDLGILKGTEGANSYGPDPLAT